MIQTEEKDYSRDPSCRALINTNVRALQEYRLKREQANKIEKIENDLTSLRNMMVELKEMLIELGTGK